VLFSFFESIVFELSDYELSRRFASSRVGVRDQRYTAEQANLISSSEVGFLSYYHSHGGSLDGIDVLGLNSNTLKFLEREIREGKKTRHVRDSPKPRGNLDSRYAIKGSGRSKRS